MDTDLSLIEISGADDSLLQQETLNGDACNVYSSCSPLCSIRPKPSPRTFGMTPNEGAEESGSASSTGSFNKENVNVNKSDTLKLSLEPQQMKRKKKGGGYNLRKSLAWDKAFFTEEGVLDSMELSMISGNLGCLGGDKLTVIHEEESESLSEVPEDQDDSADLLALEEKLFKDLPTMAAKECKAKTPLHTPLKRDGVAKIRNNVILPSPRNTPRTKRRVLSAQDVNKSGSKSTGGQRPTASSLLKRTGNVNATKAASKESKALRLPVSTQEPTTISSTSKSNIPTGQLKRTQPAQPVISTPKNVRVKSSSNNAKNAGSTALIGPGGKSSTAKSTLPQAKRNVSNATAKTRSSTHKTPVDLPTPRLPNERDGGSRTTGVSLPLKIQPVAAPRQNVLIQTAKPSGLRMPSPSMGFFDQQAKASATRNLLHKSTKSDDLPQPISANLKNPSSVKALNELRPPHSNAKASGMVNGVANENIRLNLRQGSSSSISLRSDLHEKKNSNAELHNLQKLKLKTKHDLRSEPSSTQQDLQSSFDDVSTQHQECAKPCESAKKLQTDDEEMKMKEKLRCIQTKSCISPRKHGDGMASDVSHEEADMNHEEVEKSKLTSNVTLALENNFFSMGKNIVDFQPMQVSLSLAITNVSGSGTQQVLPRLQETETSKDFQECDSSKNSDVRVVLGDDTASEKKRSQALNRSEDKEHEEDDSVGMRNSIKKMKIEDAENPFLPGLQETEPSKDFQECDSSKNADVSVVLGDDTASEKKRSHALNRSEGKEHDSVGMRNSSKKMKIEDAQNLFLPGLQETEPSKDFQECDFSENADVSVVLGDDTASEKKRSQAVNGSEGKEHEKDDSVGMRNSSKKMKIEDAENPFLPRLQETEPSKDFQECDSSKNSDVSVVLGDDTASEKKRSQALNGSEGKEHEEDDSVGMRNFSKKMKIKDAENPFLDGNMTAGRSSTSPSCSIFEGEFTKYGDGEGQAELPCCTAVQDMEDIEESLEANGLLQAGNCGSKLNISNVPCPEPLTMQATSGDFFEVHPNGKVELCKEVKCKGQLTGSATNSESSSSKLARDAFGAMEMGNQSSVCHMFSAVETEDSSSVAVFVEEEVLEDEHCPQYVENISSNVHPWDGIRSSREDTSVYNALLISNSDAHEQPAEIIRPNYYSSEPDIPPQGDSHLGSSEQEQSFNSNTMVVGSPDVKGPMVTEAKASQAPLEKVDVDPKGDDMTEDTEAGQMQLGNDCLSDVCRKRNLSSSAAKTELLQVADLDSRCDECNENQDCCKVENDFQHSQGMPGFDCSLKEPSEEDMVIDSNHSEPLRPDLCMAAEANVHNVSSIMDKNGEKAHIEDVASILVNENKQNDMKIEVDVSAEMIGEPIQELQNIANSRASCSLDDELCPTSSDTQRELSVQQTGEDSKLKSGTLPEGPVPTHQVTDNSAGENHKSGQKQDAAVVKPPPDAAPFSDEWLAAFEAAGEEILTKKSGAVQNSPPEKALPEPGPWSPVKKKNNQVIGPFDCTKCTNVNINSSPQ